MADRDTKDELAQLRQGLDEVRGSVASLVARFGEDAADAGGRGLQQARRAAGEVARNVADQAGDVSMQEGQSMRAQHEPLLPSDQTDRFTSRWQEIQTSFVDEPRDAVAEADALVADLMQRLAASFSQERERLEGQWDRGDDVSTEDLRVALTRYRSFFDRLLST